MALTNYLSLHEDIEKNHAELEFTIFKNEKGLLSKTYDILDDKVVKLPAANMFEGSATRISTTFDIFKGLLEGADSNMAFGYGIYDELYGQQVSITTKGNEKPEDNVLSRTKEYFSYPDKPGILMLDYDPNEYGPSISSDDLLQILAGIVPGFNNTASIIKPSVSSSVCKVGEQPKSNGGFHLYVPVVNAGDIPRFGKVLFDKLWLNSYGYFALSACGSLLSRTLIDGAVFSPERLDFVGKPEIESKLLHFEQDNCIYNPGKYLDTTKLLDLTSSEAEELAAKIMHAKELIQTSSEAKKDIYIANKISELTTYGCSEEIARKTVQHMVASDFKNIYGDCVLTFSDEQLGKVSAKELFNNPSIYDQKSLADPIEGATYGVSTAMFFWNDGKCPVINSMAHGGMKYHVFEELLEYSLDNQNVTLGIIQSSSDRMPAISTKTWEERLEQHVAKFNENHAQVMIGQKYRIMRITKGDATHDGRDTYEFIGKTDLSAIYDNTQIKTGEKESRGKVSDIYSNHFNAWVKHHKSLTYKGGVVFLPGRKTTDDYLNTWRGFSIAAKKNSELLDPVYYHIKNVVCADDPNLFEYFIKWCAFTFQNPDKPAGAALVLRGSKGTGKGSIGHFLREIWGNHGLHISNPKHFIGQFNAHLNDVCFLFADEAFYSGDKQHEGVLKALITEPKLIIERKGIDAVSQPNFLKVFMATNSDFAVPASRDERRYCVFDVADTHKDDRKYFASLHTVLSNREVQAAFLFDMLDIDIAGWHPGSIPDSRGLRAQRYHSMKSHQIWLVDSLISGSFNDDNEWRTIIPSKELYDSYCKWCDNAKTGEYRRASQCTVSSYIGQIFVSTRIGRKQLRGFYFGALSEAIAKFENYEKISLEELNPE